MTHFAIYNFWDIKFWNFEILGLPPKLYSSSGFYIFHAAKPGPLKKAYGRGPDKWPEKTGLIKPLITQQQDG